MKTGSLLLIGASGAVGHEVLALALADARVKQVTAPTRRALPAHPKLTNPVIDFSCLPEAAWWKADACICTLGTTLNIAGSKEAFEKIDRHLVVATARRASSAGTPVFAYNSSLGANPHARSFYLRMKGLIEADLQAVGFASLTFVRPSLLEPTGPRATRRQGEQLMLALMRPLGFMLPKRFRVVKTTWVARCLLEAACRAEPGVTVIESEAIQPERQSSSRVLP